MLELGTDCLFAARQHWLVIAGEDDHGDLGEEDPIGLILCGSRGEQVVELLLSSQTNRLRVAQSLLPEDTAALQARLAQITAAYEQRGRVRKTYPRSRKTPPQVAGC